MGGQSPPKTISAGHLFLFGDGNAPHWDGSQGQSSPRLFMRGHAEGFLEHLEKQHLKVLTAPLAIGFFFSFCFWIVILPRENKGGMGKN